MSLTRRRAWESPSAPANSPAVASSRHLSASKDETLLLSSAGDVLTCRCRDSAISTALTQERWTGYDWGAELAALCCKGEYDDLSAHLQDTGFCGHFGGAVKPTAARRTRSVPAGLLGGAPAEVAPLTPLQRMMETPPRSKASAEAMARNKERAFRIHAPAEGDTMSASDDVSILPIQSFDYSHFAEGGNDMLPESVERKQPKAKCTRTRSGDAPDVNRIQPATTADSLIHGVPTFLSTLLNVKITQVSAHPLGSHVLLVSASGILFSYGLNTHGQLGIGVKTQLKDGKKGYIMMPTIVTPLLENGGKALRAAAGVDHSLVLVMTEERRIVKSSSPCHPQPPPPPQDAEDQTETVMYHQIYGFGRNDSMKIGLLNPKKSPVDDSNCVCLPKRVALRCKVRPVEQERGKCTQSQMGIFALEASETHSAALVRRASGDVELYMWGRALHGALGFGSTHIVAEGDARPLPRVVPVPTLVECLSRRTKVNDRSQKSFLDDEGEYPAQVTLGKCCSFVVTSSGRCFSFGTSLEGMLGHGPSLLEIDSPKELNLSPSTRVQMISAGASHVLALTRDGLVYAWGRRVPPTRSESVDHLTGEEQLNAMDVDWLPKQLAMKDIMSDEEKKDELGAARILEVCAGYDNSFLVTESGHVFSCGRRSGRLGLGEVRADVPSPQPLFGGLRLWQEHSLTVKKQIRQLPQTPNRPELKRGFSASAF